MGCHAERGKTADGSTEVDPLQPVLQALVLRRGAFWKFAEGSDFIDEIRAYKVAYDDAKKAADSACLARMIDRCNEISVSETTFRKLNEKGVRIRL